jgi:flap endonuclease-1
MGVKIGDLVTAVEIEIKDLSGKKIAIDAFNTMYQFLSKIRQPDGSPLMTSKGEITSVHSGILYRTANLLEDGIIPVYVFDGEPPEFKRETVEKRREERDEAKKKWEEALKMGDLESAQKYAQAALLLTEEMIEDAKKILKLIGVPVVQAPSEGEAQAAHMARKGDVFAAASQDYDSLLFGSPRLVRNLTITGKRKLPGKDVYVENPPEIIELERTLSDLGITREQLIIIGIIVGTDYNPDGIKGYGPKRALEVAKKCKKPEDITRFVEWSFDISPVDLYNFFLNPPVTDSYNVDLSPPDKEGLIRFMVDEHEFSEDRVRKVAERVEESFKRASYKGLEAWF